MASSITVLKEKTIIISKNPVECSKALKFSRLIEGNSFSRSIKPIVPNFLIIWIRIFKSVSWWYEKSLNEYVWWICVKYILQKKEDMCLLYFKIIYADRKSYQWWENTYFSVNFLKKIFSSLFENWNSYSN